MKKNFFNLNTCERKDASKYKPCILSENQVQGLLESEILKIYHPAIKNPRLRIPLSPISDAQLPKSPQELLMLKRNLRYVWCDGYESSFWETRECKYLGIRITESFILHETVINETWGSFMFQWRDKCQARLLLRNEIMLLNLLWDDVSHMRVQANDTPLPKSSRFWVLHPQGRFTHEVYRHARRSGEYLDRLTESGACLLLAVTN